MVQLDLKLVSLNVNGLGNPIKRAKVMAKLKREEVHVIYLQETHLSREEHEKLKTIWLQEHLLCFILTN